jgi:probable rRNA maturation factor
MSRVLALRNRQRVRAVDTRLLRRIAAWMLAELFRAAGYELGVHLVTAGEMTRLNKAFLGHEGSTDVLTFNHQEGAQASRLPPRASRPRRSRARRPGGRRDACPTFHGEIFISLDDAVAQARQFRATWQDELVRYLLHGLLHLEGFDDVTPAARVRMKREETRLLRRTARQFPLRRLARSKP